MIVMPMPMKLIDYQEHDVERLRPAMTAALRVTAAAGATTGEVLPSGKVNRWSGILPDQTQRARAKAAGISVRTQRKLDRLARNCPDLLAEVRAGRMSAHRAALEAGIVKELPRVERSCWNVADHGDGPDGDRAHWHAVRQALDRLADCPLAAKDLVRLTPTYCVLRMTATTRAASQLLAALADHLERRARGLAPRETTPKGERRP